MSVTKVAGKGIMGGYEGKSHNGFMTTTELAKLCGVSRFTILNWAKQGRIKATRTVGKHYRIPVSEALSLLKSFNNENKLPVSEPKEPCQQDSPTTSDDVKCGNCSTSNEKNTQIKSKKKILYAVGYGVSRGVNILKVRRKVK